MNSFSGLSILIPVFNFPVFQLVEELHLQAKKLEIRFEVLCYDDASDDPVIKLQNKGIEELEQVVYKEFEENKGRAQIRNILAKQSRYDWLLFIDSDSKIHSSDFIEKYIDASKSCDVVAGGTIYSEEHSEEYSLRYKYGKRREQLSPGERAKDPYKTLCLNNLLLKKDIFLDHLLDENILTYGHEDTKFALSLKKSGVNVCHINNPVEHIGLEKNTVFLDKTKDGVGNFLYLSREGIVQQTKLFKAYQFLRITKLSKLFLVIYALADKQVKKNLLSHNPSIFLFDLYKLQLLVRFSNKGGA